MFELGLILLFGGGVYFLPTIVASMRNHHDQGGIFLINLLLGWTFLGWVIALVWSATTVRAKEPPQPLWPAPQGGVTVTLTEEQARRLGIGGDSESKNDRG